MAPVPRDGEELMSKPPAGAGAPLAGSSPYAKALMKAMGGDPRFMTAHPEKIRRWALDRPESVLNLIPDTAFSELVAEIPQEFFEKSELQLQEMCPSGTPSRVDRRVRTNFWEEYESAARDRRKMDLDLVVADTGARNWPAFVEQLTQSTALMSWFMNPPASYKLQMKEAQALGLDRLSEIMTLPIKDPATGRINPAIASIILQAWRLVDIRINGMPTQKQVLVTANAGSAPANSTMDLGALDIKLKELEKMLSTTALAPPVAAPEKGPEKEAEVVVE